MARQWNAIEMAFRWGADGGPTLNASRWFLGKFGPVLLRNPIVLWFFRGDGGGGGVQTPSSPLHPPMIRCSTWLSYIQHFSLIILHTPLIKRISFDKFPGSFQVFKGICVKFQDKWPIFQVLGLFKFCMNPINGLVA